MRHNRLAALIAAGAVVAGAGAGLSACSSSPLSTCESQIKADAAYTSWDGSLPASCTGSTNGRYTLNDQQLREATHFADNLIENEVPTKPGNVPFGG